MYSEIQAIILRKCPPLSGHPDWCSLWSGWKGACAQSFHLPQRARLYQIRVASVHANRFDLELNQEWVGWTPRKVILLCWGTQLLMLYSKIEAYYLLVVAEKYIIALPVVLCQQWNSSEVTRVRLKAKLEVECQGRQRTTTDTIYNWI